MRAMICLYIPTGVAELIAAPLQDQLSGVIAEAPEDLHITLAYFPEITEEEKDELIAAAARASLYYSPVQTEVEGAAQFFAEEDEPTPYVLLVNPDRLMGLRSEVLLNCGHLRPATNHGFIPHITLAYLHGAESAFSPPDLPDIPILLETISVKFGDGEQHDFRIGTPHMSEVYRTLDLREKVDAASNVSETPEHQLSAVPTKDSDKMTDTTSQKAGRRMAGSWRDKLGSAMGMLKELLAFADYEDEEEEEDKQVKMLNESATFLVFKDNLDQERWLSYSSNAFKDREQEIVSTKCLEQMVEFAEKTGERGPLRLFHIPGFDIGKCDFQAVHGRFLIESGTFDDTPLALAAKAYIESCPEELGVSIGFTHPLDAFKDGVYDAGVIRERSVCPLVYAANPFTSFTKLKGGAMNSTQEAWLRKAVGDDLFESIVNDAESATKQLEGSVAFKDNAAVQAAIETLKAHAPSDDAKGALDAVVLSFATKAKAEGGDGDQEDGDEGDGEKAVAAMLAGLSESIKGLDERIAAKIDSSIDAAKTSLSAEIGKIDERLKAVETVTKTAPAATSASAFRASASKENIVSEDDVAKAKIEATSAPPSSPVASFVSMIRAGGEGA